MELKQKGTKADIGAFKRMDISLIWRAAVDLDLMAFYRTRTVAPAASIPTTTRVAPWAPWTRFRISACPEMRG